MALTNYERWKKWVKEHPEERRRLALESYHRRKKLKIKTRPIDDVLLPIKEKVSFLPGSAAQVVHAVSEELPEYITMD